MTNKIDVEVTGFFWAVLIFCIFVFTRGCSESPSNFEQYLKAKYGHDAQQYEQEVLDRQWN